MYIVIIHSFLKEQNVWGVYIYMYVCHKCSLSGCVKNCYKLESRRIIIILLYCKVAVYSLLYIVIFITTVFLVLKFLKNYKTVLKTDCSQFCFKTFLFAHAEYSSFSTTGENQYANV